MPSDFFYRWEQERSAGFRKYYIRHLLGVLCIFAGVTFGDYVADKKLSLLSVIIYLIIALMFPVVAWVINQSRYQKHITDHQ